MHEKPCLIPILSNHTSPYYRLYFYCLWNHWAHSHYFENRIPLNPYVARWWGWGGEGGGRRGGGAGAYVASQTTVPCMKRLNKTKSAIFVLLLFFVSKGNLLDFYGTNMPILFCHPPEKGSALNGNNFPFRSFFQNGFGVQKSKEALTKVLTCRQSTTCIQSSCILHWWRQT